MEFTTKQDPRIINKSGFEFATRSLAARAPRIKWESAKVIGNVAHLFPAMLDTAIKNLLINTVHESTVVRWSATFALAEIMKLKTKHREALLHAFETILNKEEKNSIKKIYLAAIKKTGN